MGVVSWVVLGAGMGFVVSLVMSARFPGGTIGCLVSGAAGAVVGGALFSLLAGRSASSPEGLTMLLAAFGAGAMLLVMRFADHDPQLDRSGPV